MNAASAVEVRSREPFGRLILLCSLRIEAITGPNMVE